ncbi:glycosyltransferase family 4 protein [Nodosilinea sp. FACHB-131]|uniref:glycosyltransferase family 4 protein n=1 Tax=Cyanophyceae TaxID=3028117 RepID=UPI001689F61B|nr:glycosyltransferase family 4 protein [Nodosilinea sp. FACHB-131]MBD1874008.1 glycosyltransferase family 4 protein [Nodosilinea sp. FACHB-131]
MRANHNRPNLPLQVSILTQFFPPDYAATGQLVEELAQSFSRQGVGVQVFAGQPGYAYDRRLAPKQEEAQGVTIRRTRTSRLWPRRIRGRAVGGLLYCLRSLIKLLHPDRRGQLLLVTTEPPYLPVLAYLMYCLFGQPYLCVVYDLYPEVALALGVVSKHHWLVRLWRWLNCRTWHRAEAIVVLSPTMKQRIVDHCPQAADKISVIHNWADPSLIVPLPKVDNWFALHHQLDQVFTVLYSGNMGRCHDMDTILAAAIALRHEPVRFVFIGAGAKRQLCVDRTARAALTNCLFLPYQAKEILPFSLTACDLSLVSLVEGVEGLVAPSKLYGSLAAGRPVAAICEPHSYLRSLLAEGEFGRAFSNGDSAGLANFIRTLVANPALVQQMGNRGRHYMQQKFTPEQGTDRYFEVVKACLRTPVAPPLTEVPKATVSRP